MIENVFVWALATMNSVLSIVLLGILFVKYFDKDLRNKDGIGIVFLAFLFWGVFFFSGLYGMIASPSSISVFLCYVSFIFAFLFFSCSACKYYRFVNFWLIISEFFLFSLLAVMIFVDRFAYDESFLNVIFLIASITTWVGYFITIGFLIKREELR